MKPALRWIPTEVWVDVLCFPWIGRRKLGKIVDKIGNRYFAEILQYCLHDRGKRTLERLDLYKGSSGVQTQMPENFKFFHYIGIWHFDSSTLDFLRRISGLLLINDVNLHFDLLDPKDLASLRTILHHLAPLIHGIHSLAFDQHAIPLVEQHFHAQLAQVKMLSLNYDFYSHVRFDPATNQAFNFCLNWLILKEDSGQIEPKFLELKYCPELEQFSMAVQQQFQSAKRPSTFVIKFHCYGKDEFHLDLLENNIGEQLHGRFDEQGHFWIYRHQADITKTQLEEWVKGSVEISHKSSVIKFSPWLTIEQIDDANAGADEVDANAGEEEADQQPSTSE